MCRRAPVLSCKSHRDQGLSLIECLAAVVILGTAIVAALAMLGMHEGLASAEEEAYQGYLLLEREVDRAFGESFDQLETTAYEPLADASAYSVRRVVSNFSTDVKSVELFLRWTRSSGVLREHSVTILRHEGS